MATSSAIRAAGSKFQVRISGVYTLINDAVGGEGLGGAAEDIESTPIDEDQFKHFLTDLADPGTFSIEANFVPGSVVHNYLLNAYKTGTLEAFKIIWSNLLETTFSARVNDFTRAIQRGNLVTAQIALRITGAIVDP